MNFKFIISYDGFKFCGSQKQSNKATVENSILEVLKKLGVKEPKIILSGRTDSGVHATRQVFNTILPLHLQDIKKCKELFNFHLSMAIRVLKIERVPLNFHSRFSAKKRIYRYVISENEPNAFLAKYVTFVKSIDENIIKEAIKEFVGIYNFEYFHKKGSNKTNFVKEIYEARFYKYKNFYIFKFKANSYLRSQIRLMVGFLLAISQKKRDINDLKEQLQRKKNSLFKIAPPYGLYLTKVIYSKN